jgi:signal transduction histidine kinase
MNLVYGQQQVDDAHTQEWLKARDAGYEVILHQPLESVTLAEREEELLTWLENYGVQNAWKLSEPLASGGVESQTLDHLMERWRTNQTELRDMGLRWLALSFDVMEMIASGLRGAERISELIQSMKSYSYMDQGAQQLVDIHEGLESTLTLFSHKLKQGIEVRKRYDRLLPRIMVYGSELNQVWTNLIDNAIDAMGETGILEIETLQSNSYIQVQIADSGAGISADLQSRIFEPFFTTKSVGKGSGLGLDVTRRIVENRHNGTLSLQSQPGRTTFCVCLPIERHTPEQTAVEPTSRSTDSPT